MRKEKIRKHNIKDVPYIECPYCKNSKKFKMLHWKHLKDLHNKTIDDLLEEFPSIPTMTLEESNKRSKRRNKCYNKIKETCLKKYGGVGYSSIELDKKSKLTTKNKFGNENIMRTRKGLKILKQTFLEKYGVDNPLKDSEISNKKSEKMKGKPSKLKGKTYEEIHGKEKSEQLKEDKKISGAKGYLLAPKISKPQIELYKLVKSIEPSAELDYPLIGYVLDIAIPEKKICIEYDGSYWHQDKNKDKKRDEVLERIGWKTIRFIDRIPTISELNSFLLTIGAKDIVKV